MQIVILTGGIASGKSTATAFFRDHHIPVIAADDITRQLMMPSTPIYDKIVAHFGQSVLSADKTLNRRQLRQQIFNNPSDKQWLEDLVHPAVRATMTAEIAKIQDVLDPNKAHPPYVVLDIPLYAESPIPYHPEGAHVLVLDCDEATQCQRLMARDNLTEDQAQQIIKQQAPRDKRLAMANTVISNQSSLDHFKRELTLFHEKILDQI